MKALHSLGGGRTLSALSASKSTAPTHRRIAGSISNGKHAYARAAASRSVFRFRARGVVFAVHGAGSIGASARCVAINASTASDGVMAVVLRLIGKGITPAHVRRANSLCRAESAVT